MVRDGAFLEMEGTFAGAGTGSGGSAGCGCVADVGGISGVMLGWFLGRGVLDVIEVRSRTDN